MSLIEQALRRVQNPAMPQAPAPPSKTPAPQSQAPAAHSWSADPQPAPAGKPVRATRIILNMVFGVLIVSAVMVLGSAYWVAWQFRNADTPVIGQAAGLVADASLPEAAEQHAAPSLAERLGLAKLVAPATPTFVLSGVVVGGGDPYAVINGEILGVGEAVEGATLLEIANGAVRLRSATGDDIALKLAR